MNRYSQRKRMCGLVHREYLLSYLQYVRYKLPLFIHYLGAIPFQVLGISINNVILENSDRRRPKLR